MAAQAKYQKWTQGKELGRGSFGRVVSLCKEGEEGESGNGSCEHVLKIIAIQHDTAKVHDYDLLDLAIREPLFLHRLRNVKLKGKPITPTLQDAWICFPWFYVVMDKWDGDMDHLAREQAGDEPGVLRFTYPQFLKMFQIIELLTKLGIVHGDLKLDQFLQRNKGNDIVITDFGLAGDAAAADNGKTMVYAPRMGWSHSIGCPATKPIKELIASPSLKRYFNAWQFESALANSHVLIDNPRTGEPMVFRGVKIPPVVRSTFQKICTESRIPRAQWLQGQRELAQHLRAPMFAIDLDELNV